jgi:HPt (histidine-containing phosphotransfer) domain-containing protein
LLDDVALQSLAEDLGPTADTVIAEFVAELRLGYEALSASGVVEDGPRLRHAAHRMLGAARTLGAKRLAGIIEAMHAQLHAGGDPSTFLRQVLDISVQTLPLAEAWLKRRGATDTSRPQLADTGVGD